MIYKNKNAKYIYAPDQNKNYNGKRRYVISKKI